MNQKGFTPIIAVALVCIIAVAGFFAYSYFNKPSEYPNNSQAQKPLFLTLESPTQDTSAVNDRIMIKGKTLPNTTVVLYNESDEATLESNAQGEFEGKLMLGEGQNNLVISAFSDTGEEKTLNVSIDYTLQS